MGKLITPFGEIDIIIDGQPVSYTARAGKKIKKLCSDVLGRFQIVVHYVPDGKEHSIACVFTPGCSYEKTQESGERLECQSFYNDCRFKMSVGVECEAGYVGGKRLSDEYDYDVGGKMNLPPHGKEIFTDAVSSILHRMVRSFLHGTVNRILQIT